MSIRKWLLLYLLITGIAFAIGLEHKRQLKARAIPIYEEQSAALSLPASYVFSFQREAQA